VAQDAESAVRIAILSEPESFGLTKAQVNPALLYHLRKVEVGEGMGADELYRQCFESVQTCLYNKVVEVFTGMKLVMPGVPAVKEGKNEPSEPEEQQPPPKAKPKQPKPASRKPAPSKDMLTTKQLRYIGYLLRQLGETPNYQEIANLTQSEATGRIMELQAKVNG
jgi:hypothetical protein